MTVLPLTRAAVPAVAARTLLGFALLTAFGCVLVAALLTLLVPSAGRFVDNLIVSECIGLSIVGWVMLLRRAPQLRRLGRGGATIAVTLVAMPLGYLSGYTLAYALLGRPVAEVMVGSGRMVAIATTLLATGVIGYFAWMRGRLAVEAAARSEAQRLAAEAQLRLLQSQLEPHMLFNTLANLRSLIDEDPKLAQTMIDQLITYLRSALAASRTELVPLRQEFLQLRAYLEIMALRMGSRLSFGLDLPEALQNLAVPPMLLQPLVENAIRHGLEPKVGGGRIDVQARSGATGVEISITDSGLGLPADSGGGDASTDPTSGYGLQHVRDRLAAVYGASASLTLERQLPHGVCATVSIAT
ncbi:MAG: histidine kinase [Ideonella sp.]